MIIGRGAVDVNGVATINRPRQSSNSKGFVHVALSPQATKRARACNLFFYKEFAAIIAPKSFNT